MKKLLTTLPDLDGVVMSAGCGITLPVKLARKDRVKDMFETNVFSQIELTRLLYKEKKLKKDSSVVLISSVGGNYAFENGNMPYGASKAALNSFMKYAAKEFAIRGIRVNSICPGRVDTQMIHQGVFTEDQIEAYKAKYPLGRYGKPEEIAYAAIYLLSDAAAWVTGTSIVIDGGSTTNV